MKVLALVYPGMTLLDLVGPMQAWSLLPRLRSSVRLAPYRRGAHGLWAQRTSDQQLRGRVGGSRRPLRWGRCDADIGFTP